MKAPLFLLAAALVGCAGATPSPSSSALVVVAPLPAVTSASVAPVTPTPTSTSTPARPPVGTVGGRVSRPLNAVVVPFAHYLNGMHNRIHPEFADKVLARLDALALNDALNDTTLITRFEIVIDGKTGNVVRLEVIKPSGQPTFDALGLEALKHAEPFAPAELVLWSTDGNVYVHWELHRDEVFACSTMHARPFLLDLEAAQP